MTVRFGNVKVPGDPDKNFSTGLEETEAWPSGQRREWETSYEEETATPDNRDDD